MERAEAEAAAAARPNPGAEEILRWLRDRGLRVGIISRNRQCSIKRALENFTCTRPSDFDLIITRDMPVAPKPSPDSIRLAAERLCLATGQILMVGDNPLDVQAGVSAGSPTVLLRAAPPTPPPAQTCDYTISRLKELTDIVRLRLPLPAGKFPNDLLQGLLDELHFEDASVLINPGIGEDTAAVRVDGEEVLVLKSDPITFATDSIGQYAVVINANDIATSGALPRWFLTTLLFPCLTTPLAIIAVVRDLARGCRRYGITLCGGHTEITDAVTRPVVTGMLAGTVARRNLLDKKNMQPGNRILLTKALAVEGTAIIAREFADRLRELGLADSEIEVGRNFLADISILTEAAEGRRSTGTRAMHDVTEGGLATALEELSLAGGHRLRIHVDRIPILPETEKICRRLGLNPLGLIGSGSLLICCAAENCSALEENIRARGIAVTCIGEVTHAGRGVEALRGGHPVPWPTFAVDEITRLF